MIVVLDSNIYISGIVFGGWSLSVLVSVLAGDHTGVYCPSIRAEVTDTLIDKFGWSVEDASQRTRAFWTEFKLIEASLSIDACRDPDDNRILECAVSAKAGAIVTGDKDLLVMSPFREILILTPAAFAEFHSIET